MMRRAPFKLLNHFQGEAYYSGDFSSLTEDCIYVVSPEVKDVFKTEERLARFLEGFENWRNDEFLDETADYDIKVSTCLYTCESDEDSSFSVGRESLATIHFTLKMESAAAEDAGCDIPTIVDVSLKK